MIQYYHKAAIQLHAIRYALWLALIASIAASVYFLFAPADRSTLYLMPSILFTTWLLLCLATAYYFNVLPNHPGQNAPWFSRVKFQAGKLFRYFVAVLFTVNTGLLLWLTSKAVGLVMG